MARKRYTAEQIIGHLRQAEIRISECKTVGHVRETLAVSERRACRVLGQVRRTQRYTLKVADDKTVLTANIVSLASEYGRYGYRRITALLKTDGWQVNHKEQIWRLEGLKVPTRQPKRGRLWFGSCIRLRPEPQPRLGLRFRIRSDA